MSIELKKRYDHIVYTLKHKIAFLEVEKKLRGHNTIRGYLHDIDKPFLYLALWLDMKDIQTIHRRNNKHHVRNNLKKSKEDLIDTIIDWECARITKLDKPLNAYQTLMKFYPEYKDEFLPIIKELLPHQVPKESKSIKILPNKRELYFFGNKNIYTSTIQVKRDLLDKQR
ncbi:MAG: hypothetical protein IJZ30_02935 [Alphaproteobacteria bacterium]|nr:hypothetical protein [Alphaproteobacteria bacterium]